MEENATKSLGEELIPLDLQLKKQADLMKKTLIYEVGGYLYYMFRSRG